jgi:hypothetical protein
MKGIIGLSGTISFPSVKVIEFKANQPLLKKK